MLLTLNRTYTDEELGLYDDMLLNRPEVRSVPILRIGICVVGKRKPKRFLCCMVAANFPDGFGYLHYHPDGATPQEIQLVGALHHMTRVEGLNECRFFGKLRMDKEVIRLPEGP